MATEFKCAGCGAEFRVLTGRNEPDYEDAARVTIGNEHVWLCTSGRGRGVKVQSRYDVKASCARSAFEKASLCPGCDKAKVWPGTMCDKCLEELEVVRRGKSESQADSFVIDDDYLPSLFNTAVHDTDERISELTTLLAKALTRRGEEVRREQSKNVIPARADKGGFYSGVHGPRVVLSKEQAESLGAFLTGLREVFEAQRVAGRYEGRSLLVGLARGELTIAEFNEKEKGLDDVK